MTFTQLSKDEFMDNKKYKKLNKDELMVNLAFLLEDKLRNLDKHKDDKAFRMSIIINRLQQRKKKQIIEMIESGTLEKHIIH